MAPRTRSRVNSSQDTTEEKATKPSETPVQEKPVSSRGKRKSIGDDIDSDRDDGDSAPLIPESGSPKRQRLAVRTREEETTPTGRKTYIEVEIPVSNKPESVAIPDSQDSNEGVVESGPDAELSSASKQLEEEASQNLASQSLEPEPTSSSKPKGKHVVFGDDDDIEKFVASAAAQEDKKAENEDDKNEVEESDDDDAPEAVSTQAAAKEVQMAAQAASEAAEKQAASLKRKRQEKDSLYKQQAERRKRSRATVEVHQRKAKSSGKERGSSEDNGVAEVETAVTAGRRRAQKFNLPTVLPAEFLTDSSSEDEDFDESALRAIKKPKKINFETENKRPKDQIVGSTRYRVLAEQGDQKLAPRIQKNARDSKESLLKRKRAGMVAGAGAGAKKGFFVRR
ncbi:uncharacterized protein GGS22DRAFT_190098 [Annulohypoxylon maeteangense]|uniref:uncharacterized protein n=1 Tax=Annulohypoxylon maeteangense TaxID=1927788 RepID=UPI0020084AFB|nr:uncharacterized protein GGS22DRAFT_190098 [Annulohypoxylon maeteangense]KAI0883440.1 hypothetical protein GGS22DRAFT_190098 [Annulohypoxylon maeteangense]